MATYISWWYGQGLLGFWQGILIMTEKIYSFFSIRTLVRTLFDPWKRDIYGAENVSLETRLQILMNNLISRCIGAVIRIFTIIFGIIMTAMFFIFMLSFLVIWLSLPIVILFFIFNGIRMVFNG